MSTKHCVFTFVYLPCVCLVLQRCWVCWEQPSMSFQRSTSVSCISLTLCSCPLAASNRVAFLLFVPRFCCINACLCLAETCTVWRLALSASQRPRTDLHSSVSLCFCSCCSAPPALPGLDHVCGGEPLQLLLCISLHMLPSNAAFVVPLAGWLCGLADWLT